MTVSLDGVRMAGTEPEYALEAVVFAAGAADVRHVLVDGRELVRDGRHATIDVARELHEAIAEGRRRERPRHRQHRPPRDGRALPRRGAARARARRRRSSSTASGSRASSVPGRPGTSGSTPPVAASSRDSWTATPISSSPATAPTSSPPGWPADPMRRPGSGSRPPLPEPRARRNCGGSRAPDAPRPCGRGSLTWRSSPATGSSLRPSAARALSPPS